MTHNLAKTTTLSFKEKEQDMVITLSPEHYPTSKTGRLHEDYKS